MKLSFYQYTYEKLATLLFMNNLPQAGANILFNWHYKLKKYGPCTNKLSKKIIDFVEQNLSFDLPRIDRVQESNDKTVKFSMQLVDDLKVETVLIPFNNKYTICLSSQIGCAMNCSFCFTGTQGLKRNLNTDEIIGQFLVAQRWLTLINKFVG